MQNHLGVYSRKWDRDYIGMMFNGEKTVDIKLGYKRNPPYKRIQNGDLLYIKESSGPVVGRLRIPTVEYYEFKEQEEILQLLLRIQEPVGLLNEEHAIKMFNEVNYMKYATVFWLDTPQELKVPIHIEKHDMRTWVHDFLIPRELQFQFDYEFGDSEDKEGHTFTQK